MAVSLFLASLVVSVVAGAVSILLKQIEKTAKMAGCSLGIAAAALSLIAGLIAMLGNGESFSADFLFPFARFSLLLNPLAGLMITIISILALVAFIYGIAYLDEYEGKQARACMFLNWFVASMMLVIAADNAFWFLVAFELMSLTSYFLVIIEEKPSSIKGGFMYLVMAHIGFVFIMMSFLLMANASGSFEFSDFRATPMAPAMASACFVMAFFGFGAKAGIIPLHSWLPMAHPAAPSNVSALMSGGMIKIGIFGIVKVGLDLLAASGTQLWWGFLVLVIGAVSSVLGVVYALAEHDIKRLLAYHSVENIGIILLGVGAALVGAALDNMVLAGLGLLAALYHTFNHAMFKGELFLGAGALLYSVKTRNMEEMGGLFRRMPWTAVCFLVGALAISAIPPLNGFVSEWFTYQSLFDAALFGDKATMVFAVFAVVALALTGALAVTCFVKAYGVTFAGAPRSKEAAEAREVPTPMIVGQVVLAAVCVLLGLGAPLVAPAIAHVATSVLATPALDVVNGAATENALTGTAMSTPLIAILLVAFVALAIFGRKALNHGLAPRTADPWACGYAPDSEMPVIATSFASDVNMFLKPLYTVRDVCTKACWKVAHFFQGSVDVARAVEPQPDKILVDDVAHGVDVLGRLAQKIVGGNYSVYIMYIIVALVIFLILAVTL